MATLEASRTALIGLSDRLVASGTKLPRRTVSCTLTDLGVTFHAVLTEAGFTEIDTDEHPVAQVRLSLTSDDLLALVSGELHAMAAFGSGRLGIKASFGDLMMLRSLG